jgi:hydrogenase nickel incorporation protein HypA/HybF
LKYSKYYQFEELSSMHEMAIVDNLIEAVFEQIELYQLKKIYRVQVIAGELTGVVPEVLEFCWQICTENTPCQESELILISQPALALCNHCAKEYHFKQGFDYSCPLCGGGIKEVLSGKELYLDFIDGE